LVIPMLCAKMMRKTTLLALTGSDEHLLRMADDRFSKLAGILSGVNRRFADQVVVYSPNLVNEWHLEPYESKVSIAHHHFVDFSRFRVTRRPSARQNIVGYVGRMSEEKGILDFVRAIPIAVKQDPTLR